MTIPAISLHKGDAVAENGEWRKTAWKFVNKLNEWNTIKWILPDWHISKENAKCNELHACDGCYFQPLNHVVYVYACAFTSWDKSMSCNMPVEYLGVHYQAFTLTKGVFYRETTKYRWPQHIILTWRSPISFCLPSWSTSSIMQHILMSQFRKWLAYRTIEVM